MGCEGLAYLYVMLSRSDTAMGRFIRTFTRSTFNHVSVSLDDSLSCFVSFARYRVDIPLAGGYIQEDAQRLLYRGNPLPVVIFRLEIPEAQRQGLALLFAPAGEPDAPIYNPLGALLSWLHLPCPVPGAYTCLEFTNRLLGTRYRSIPALQKGLAPYAFFEGNLGDLVSDNGSREDLFFCRRGFVKGTGDTFAHFGRVLGRVTRLTKAPDPIAEFSFANREAK